MTSSLWVTLFVAVFLVSVAFHLELLFLLDVLLLLVAGASWLWSQNCLVGVEYRRQLGQRYLSQGEETELSIEIVNRKPLPLPWLRVEDEFPERVGLLTGKLHPHYQPLKATLIQVLTLRWYERVRRHYRICGSRRGLFEFGPATVYSGDLFGFARQEMRFKPVDLLFVYPKVVPITHFGLPAQHPFGDFKASRRVLEDPLRFMSVRDYAPGDAFRHIHWKATARTGHLQTRVYEPTTTRQFVLFVDVQTLEHSYQGVVPEYLELAASAAASIASYALDAGFQVGLFANSSIRFSQSLVHVPPSSEPAQLTRLLEALAQVTYLSVRPIEDILEAQTRHLAFGATVVVISALQTESVLTAVLDVKASGYAVTLLTIGDERLEPIVPGVPVYPIGGRKEWYQLESLDLA